MTTFLFILLVAFIIAGIMFCIATISRFFIEDDFRKQVLREYGDEIRIIKKDEMSKNFGRVYIITKFYVQISFIGLWITYDYETSKEEAERGARLIKDYRASKANLKKSSELISKEKL